MENARCSVLDLHRATIDLIRNTRSEVRLFQVILFAFNLRHPDISTAIRMAKRV